MEITAATSMRCNTRGRIIGVKNACPSASRVTSRPYDESHDEELRRLFAAGTSIEDLMLLFGRTHNGVEQRLITLGALAAEAAAVA